MSNTQPRRGWSWGQHPEINRAGGGIGWNGWQGGASPWWDDAEPIQDGSQVIRHHGWDRVTSNRIIGPSSKMGQALRPFKKEIPTAEALTRDVFFSLYKRQLEKQTGDFPMRDEYRINEEILDELLDQDEFLDVRASTQGDSFLSDMGGEKITHTVLNNLSQETKERIRRQHEIAKQMQLIQDRVSELCDLQAANPNEDLSQVVAENEAALEQLRQQIAEIRGWLSDEERGQIKKALAGQLGNIAQDMATVQAGFQALGGSMGGDKQLAYAQGVTSAFARNGADNAKKMQFAQKLLGDKKLRLIAEIAGRMADVAYQIQNSKTPLPTDELTDTQQGRDIARLLPSEVLYLADEELEDIFLTRYAMEQLMSYQIIGYTPQGRGPLVVMIDNSGSMTGDPEAWSKAVMLALRMIAERQKRDFYVIHFDSTVKREYEFLKGLAQPERMLEAVEFFSGGGTNFEPPMKAAMKKMRESRYKNADAIFVTDGLCAISPKEVEDWNTIRKRSGMHAYCILIGQDGWGLEVMKSITDKLMVVDYDKIMHEKGTDSAVLQTVFGV